MVRSAATNVRFLEGHAVELLEGGGEYFPALAAAFDAARHEIHLQAYIFAILAAVYINNSTVGHAEEH